MIVQNYHHVLTKLVGLKSALYFCRLHDLTVYYMCLKFEDGITKRKDHETRYKVTTIQSKAKLIENGPTLEPLLFLIYINDIVDIKPERNVCGQYRSHHKTKEHEGFQNEIFSTD